MKLLLAIAKIRHGACGNFRSLKPGELIEEGDLQYGMTFVCDVSEKNIGEPMKKGEAVIRLEFK